VGPDFQGRIDELQKKLEERDANQEQVEATSDGRITDLEKKLEEQNIERGQEVTLHGRITDLEVKLRPCWKCRPPLRPEKGNGERADAEAIKELEKLQGTDADRKHVEADLCGQTELGKKLT
jgi:hypothetical protein